MDLYPNNSKSDDKPKEDPEVEEKSFLIPRSAFGDNCEPGDIYKVKVLSVLDEELEVEPAGHDKKEEKESDKEDEGEKDESDDMANPVDRYMTN